MNNYQCEGYAKIALNNVLDRKGYSWDERAQIVEEFTGELMFLFDTMTPEEVEDAGR